MASLELLPNREFLIITDAGQHIKGKFGTWAMKRFCEKKNYSLSQMAESFQNKPSLSEATDLILCAIEQCHRELKTKDPFEYNDIDVCSWIDQLGGYDHENFFNLFGHCSSNSEKKSEPVAN